MHIEFKKFVIVWFILGLLWAWSILAIIFALTKHNENYMLNKVHQNLDLINYIQKDMPEIINTVETIPVEVYKLEREEQL